jgi:hypothetical protein
MFRDTVGDGLHPWSLAMETLPRGLDGKAGRGKPSKAFRDFVIMLQGPTRKRTESRRTFKDSQLRPMKPLLGAAVSVLPTTTQDERPRRDQNYGRGSWHKPRPSPPASIALSWSYPSLDHVSSGRFLTVVARPQHPIFQPAYAGRDGQKPIQPDRAGGYSAPADFKSGTQSRHESARRPLIQRARLDDFQATGVLPRRPARPVRRAVLASSGLSGRRRRLTNTVLTSFLVERLGGHI